MKCATAREQRRQEGRCLRAKGPFVPSKLGMNMGCYTAICPYNGDLFALFLPHMSVACFDIFADALAKHVGKPITLLLDRAACHTAATENDQIHPLFFPPASPELNPV